MPSHVEEQIRARIAAVRRKAEERQQQRAELAAARKAGLARRHAQRLRNQANRGDTPTADNPVVAQTDTTAGQSPKVRANRCQDATVADLRSPAGHAGTGQPDATVAQTATDHNPEENQ